MHFLVDTKNKITFGWSAKCGCSHVKYLFWYLVADNTDPKIHTPEENGDLPADTEDYITIIFVRNPYKRLVSGFLNKYKSGGQFRHLWKHPQLTFSNFVEKLKRKCWDVIDLHHFTPQTTEHFSIKVLNSKVFKCYDIENIDYDFIGQLYGKKIPTDIINKRGKHQRILNIDKDDILEDYVYDISLNDYEHKNVNYKYFYNDRIQKIVYNFYKKDFEFIKLCGIDIPFIGDSRDSELQ